ncbi:MAG TPA: Gfo/Idh/MocA family oxidoreductase [Gemmataceae bacterium]|nr:Gfo/Idh/MocA family oxidoreductase [Gemmataceae bacterium]
MNRQNNRRDFLKTTALTGVGFWVAETAPADDKNPSPNSQIQFACIGVGGKGSSDTAAAAQHGNIVALCDIDERTLDAAAKRYPKAKKYVDFRKMFDDMGKSIDAVTVSTPDHVHAVASALAMRLGKHCFTQKPLSHSLYEARRLGEIATEMKVATQMGNQGTASSGVRKAAALVRAGAIGTVKEVHVWTNRPIWPQGIDRPQGEQTPPSTVHWDLWLGPAPWRPFYQGQANARRGTYHPFNWRGWWDFGTGALGDMACHTMNLAYMALDLREPSSVEAQSSGHNKETYPKWSVIRYTFPARGDRPAVTMVWYDGGKKPPADLLNGNAVPISGSLLIGEKGKLYAAGDNGDRYQLIGDVSQPKVEFPESPGHFTEFARAIKGGPPAMSNFTHYAGPLVETVLLGNLAVWAGKKIEWDARNLRALNAPEVEPLIRPQYRKGYTL